MNIIKAAEMGGRIGVHGLALAGQSRRPTPSIVPDPLALEVEALKAELDRLSARLAATETKLADAKEAAIQGSMEARAEGRAEGLAAAETQEAARLKALERGLSEALADWSKRLQTLEPLALSIAREGLDKVLGDPSAQADLISQAIKRQLLSLEAHSVLAVEVSSVDFPDGDALARLATVLPGSARLRADGALKSGDCRLRLRLGEVDIGIARQREALSRLLHEMAEEAGL